MFTTRQLSDSTSRASHTSCRPAPPGTASLAGRPFGRVGSLPKGNAHSIRRRRAGRPPWCCRLPSMRISTPRLETLPFPALAGARPSCPDQWTPSAEQLFVPPVSWSASAACHGILHHPAVFHLRSRACPALYSTLHSSLHATYGFHPCHNDIVAFRVGSQVHLL